MGTLRQKEEHGYRGENNGLNGQREIQANVRRPVERGLELHVLSIEIVIKINLNVLQSYLLVTNDVKCR